MDEIFKLSQRTILITGGGRGLGLTIAQAVLESRGDVICVDLLEEPDVENWKHAKAAASKNGTALRYLRADVTDSQAMKAIVEEIEGSSRFPLRGVVAAAGIMVMKDAIKYPIDQLQRVLSVNVTGCFITAQVAARSFTKNNVDGSIVLIASMSGTVANRGLHASAYNISKSAVVQMARSLAAEWSTRDHGPTIRVNTLSPGYIKTNMTDELLAQKEDMKLEWIRGNMLGRLSTPDEYKAPAVFLLGDGSSYMTGFDLRVDGGHCAW
ncbi:NADP-dependent mannitol dehydrogenase [Xylogone sp. PMI_703]|nr:NADP-dependent mannitol dehydrogenase [Xylogone sp. PMI_703]